MQAAENLYIDGKWVAGEGRDMVSINPATGEQLWKGKGASYEQADAAIAAATKSLTKWKNLSFTERAEYIAKFAKILEAKQQELTLCLAQETGKPMWEAKTEISAMIGKFAISKQAYADRCKDLTSEQQGYIAITRHKPHGVVL